jgi:diamine N-acetyltransferase
MPAAEGGVGPRLTQVTRENFREACALQVKPEQEGVVASVTESLAAAYVGRDVAWPRLIYDGDQLVGFIMACFDPAAEAELYRCFLWRLNIAADMQGMGYGRFAVDALCDEARRRGERKLMVSWSDHEHGPEGFYLRLGFTPTGERNRGEIVAELPLDRAEAGIQAS